VKTYLARLYDKLGVRTRAEALAAAGQLGLLPPG
jgi:DNA-binding CsgD family transcriptional regulator